MGRTGLNLKSWQVKNGTQNASQHHFYCLLKESESWNLTVANKVPSTQFYLHLAVVADGIYAGMNKLNPNPLWHSSLSDVRESKRVLKKKKKRVLTTWSTNPSKHRWLMKDTNPAKLFPTLKNKTVRLRCRKLNKSSGFLSAQILFFFFPIQTPDWWLVNISPDWLDRHNFSCKQKTKPKNLSN